jgi:REP element-mobilizing transposase RayT
MAGTYTRLNIQIVFAVKHREPLLAKSWRQEVFAHMAETIQSKGSHPIIINGVDDHVHVFIGLNPKNSISELVSDLKRNSGLFIRDKFLRNKKFFLARRICRILIFTKCTRKGC